MGDLGGSGLRSQSGSLRPPRSDRTAAPGPSRDVIQPPVDHQEVLEDGELPDREESGEDDEGLGDFAPPSSSTMTPEPEMVAFWKSSIPAYSLSPSFRPLSSAVNRTKKWGSSAAPDFAPPKQEPFARSYFDTFKESSKASYDGAIHLMSSSGAAAHAIAYAHARIGVMQEYLAKQDATPEEREDAAPWLNCCADVATALQDASRILGANYAHGMWEVRKGVLKAASKHINSILKDSLPSDGYYFGNPEKEVLSHAQLMRAEADLNPPPAPKASRRFFQRPPAARASTTQRSRPAAADAAPSSTPSSSSSSSSKRGKGYGRSSRGGKGGQRKN